MANDRLLTFQGAGSSLLIDQGMETAIDDWEMWSTAQPDPRIAVHLPQRLACGTMDAITVATIFAALAAGASAFAAFRLDQSTRKYTEYTRLMVDRMQDQVNEMAQSRLLTAATVEELRDQVTEMRAQRSLDEEALQLGCGIEWSATVRSRAPVRVSSTRTLPV
jgi:hypothetical protein